MKRVLIGGGSGLVGSWLTDLLIDKGYEVWHLSRNQGDDSWIKTVHWDIENQEVTLKDLEQIDYIINLAGAGIADEGWSKERLEVIENSRVMSNRLIKKLIDRLDKKPKLFISASAIGYYGFITTDKVFTEKDPPGDDLLAKICVEWEKSADLVAESGVDTAKVRIGLVLSDEGGVLPKVEEPIRWGVGAVLGSGKQWMPWIHIDDLCQIFIHILENQLTGTFNAVSPKPVNNEEFTKGVAHAMNKSIALPNVPPFILRIALGKRADLVLKGSRVSSKKIEESGYSFNFPKLKDALSDLYF